MVLRLLAKRGLGLLGKKAKTISSVKPGKAASHPIIKKLKESTTKVKGYDPKNPVHKEKMNKIRTDTGKDIREVEKKHGKPKFAKGGTVRSSHNIGGRANLLEEMGRIDARRHPDAADRAEKRRVIGELNKGYNIGGRANLLEEMGRIDARRHPDAADRAEKRRVIGELNRGYKTGGRVGAKDGKWIQKATASIKRRGTKGVCTGKKFGGPTCRPGTKRYALAKTFKKMARNRKG